MKPRLFEAIMVKDTDQKHAYEELKRKVAENPFLKRYTAMGIKEGLFSDSANALGHMHDTMVDAAWPELIGRSIISVLPTTEALERFPLDGGAIAYQYAEGGAVRLSGKKPTTVDVSSNILVESGEEWTQEFSEDATWNVLDRMVGNVGRAVGVKETQKIIALYGAIAAADLATGADLAGSGAVLSWAQLLSLRHAVRKENWRPNVLAINEMQLHQLLNDDKFVKSVYLPSSQTDIEQGSIGIVLGMKVQVCNEITNGVAYAIDTRVASIMLLRRDLTVEDWYDSKTGKSGIRGSTRFGLGVLRSTAIARMTNIKTTLT
jgi:HK97 family phage major capsid protein